MSEGFIKLDDRIRFHYNDKTDLKHFMDIIYSDSQNFALIPYSVHLGGFVIPEQDFEIDHLAKQIANELIKTEFSSFVSSLKTISCKTIETRLDELANTLDSTYDELWDLGLNPEQLFVPPVLNREIRKRKETFGKGINFALGTMYPILARELEHDMIIFSNKHCFRKTYPTNLEKRIIVSQDTRFRNPLIYCQIIQNLHFINIESMRKIRVTDLQKSEFDFDS